MGAGLTGNPSSEWRSDDDECSCARGISARNRRCRYGHRLKRCALHGFRRTGRAVKPLDADSACIAQVCLDRHKPPSRPAARSHKSKYDGVDFSNAGRSCSRLCGHGRQGVRGPAVHRSLTVTARKREQGTKRLPASQPGAAAAFVKRSSRGSIGSPEPRRIQTRRSTHQSPKR
jgi:hypothetical protein